MKLNRYILIITSIITICSIIIFCALDNDSKLGAISSGILTGGIIGLIAELPTYLIQKNNEIMKIKASLYETNLFLKQFKNYLEDSLKNNWEIFKDSNDYYFNNLYNCLNVALYIDNNLYTWFQKKKLLQSYKYFAEKMLFNISNEKNYNYKICYGNKLIEKMKMNNQNQLNTMDLKDYFEKLIIKIDNYIDTINTFAYQFFNKKEITKWNEKNKIIEARLKQKYYT